MRRSWSARAAAVLVFAGLVGAGVVGTARPAAAHAVLVESTPAADAVLASPPEAITLRFNEPVSAGLGGVVVFPPEGAEIEPETVEMSVDGLTATARLPGLDPGAYAVSWRVVSADAHPIRGALTFTVGDAAAGSAASEALAERLRGAGGGGSDIVGFLFGAVRLAVFAGLSVLVGGFAFLWLVWRDGVASPGARRVLLVAWVVTLVGTLAGIGLQGAYASGRSLGAVTDFGLIGDVLETRFGIVWLLRAGLLLGVGSMILRLGRTGAAALSGRSAWSDAAVGAVLLLTPGLSGHASAGEMIPLALIADAVHLGAIAVWLGGLVMLCTTVLPGADTRPMVDIVPRFSRIASLSVVVIVVSGTFQSWRQVRFADALTDTNFGRLLLVKVAFFVGLVGVAAVSRRLVHGALALSSPRAAMPRLYAPGPAAPDLYAPGPAAPDLYAPGPAAPDLAGGPGAMAADPDAGTIARLRRCVFTEVAVAVVVLGLTAALVNAVPAREAGAESSGPFLATLEADGLLVEVEVTPAGVGANEMHIYSFGADGVTAEPIPGLEASIAQPERDLGPLPVTLDVIYPGHWVARSMEIPIAGTWTLALDARVSEFDQVRLDTPFAVRP